VVVILDGDGRGDLSFSDMAGAGIDRATDEFDQLTVTEVTKNASEDPVGDALGVDGVALIIGVGFALADPMGTAAEENPDVHFALVDAEIAGDNAASLLFAEEQGSFLVGAAAGLKTGADAVGFVGGIPIPLIQKFQAGFEAGVAEVNSGATVAVDYLTEDDFGIAFGCPPCGEESALALYEGGADIVYHAAGASGLGVFDAAQAFSEDNSTHVWAIGVDSDQYLAVDTAQQPYILTSMMKRVDTAVYDTIVAEIDGEFEAGTHLFDLSNDGVGYATSGGFLDDIAPQLDALKEDIIDGTIVVPTVPASP
jgi:basic membrane protein A